MPAAFQRMPISETRGMQAAASTLITLRTARKMTRRAPWER